MEMYDFVPEYISTETLFIEYLCRTNVIDNIINYYPENKCVGNKHVEGILREEYFGLPRDTVIYLSMEGNKINIVYTSYEDWDRIELELEHNENVSWWEDKFETGYHHLVKTKSIRLDNISFVDV